MTARTSRFNPLVLDPNDYDKLFDEEVLGLEDDDSAIDQRGKEYEHLSSYGCRRRKPAINPDY